MLAGRKTSRLPATVPQCTGSFAPCRSCATTSCSGAGQLAWKTLTLWTCLPFFETGTTAPARSLAALRWFSKHASLGWDLAHMAAMEKAAGKEVPFQWWSSAAFGNGWRRTNLSGCLSPSNCRAAWPLTLRAVVGRFARSISWSRSCSRDAWSRWKASPATRGAGWPHPWGVILGWDEATLLSLGDWQDKGQMRSSTTTVPLHYAATKYALSVRTKHWALAAARSFSDFPSWESVSPRDVEDTAEKLREGAPEHALSLASSSWHSRPSPQGVLSDNGAAAAQAGGAGASWTHGPTRAGHAIPDKRACAFRGNAEREPLVPSLPDLTMP